MALPKVKTTITYSGEEHKDLTTEANAQSRSINEIVREATRLYLEQQALKRQPKEAIH